jgi:hypothetical protein
MHIPLEVEWLGGSDGMNRQDNPRMRISVDG